LAALIDYLCFSLYRRRFSRGAKIGSQRFLHCPQEKQYRGGVAMEMAPEVQENSDEAPEQTVSHELVMRILKLRWMGMDDEAERARLALQKVEPQTTVEPGPVDTD
jgi:hypothetical protein